MPKMYSYVVARDYGFAPNPFHGFCTLATCKPEIRRTAHVGDWIVGTGSKKKGRDAHVVYAMRVTEKMTFNAYWRDLTAYDATYLELAMRRRLPLATLDRALRAAAHAEGRMMPMFE